MTVGLPGTGIYWTETAPPAQPVHAGHRMAFALLGALIVALVAWALR